MKYCCQKLKKFIEDSIVAGESIISELDGEFYIAKEVRSCDDGDGYIDTWVDDTTKITYCPYCGKKL